MRLTKGGLIDRTRALTFRFNGRNYIGHPGDTLASALLANDVTLVGRSFKYHRPRGIMGAGPEDANALVRIGAGSRAEPNLKATELALFDGLVAESVNCWPSPRFDLRAINQLAAPIFTAGFYYKTFIWPNWDRFKGPIRRAAGLGIAPDGPNPDRYIHAHQACDVLVVGSGPHGLRASLDAARQGRSVILAEADFRMGGSGLWCGDQTTDASETELRQLDNVTILTRTTVFGYYDHNGLAAVEHLGMGGLHQRLWHLRAHEVVLATGATERPLVFAGNDRPGVMLASAGQAYLGRYGVLAGRRVVVFTNNDSAYEAAEAFVAAGARVTIVDARSNTPAFGSGKILKSHHLARVTGRARVRAVDASPADGGAACRIDCDLILMSGGWTPNVHLFSQSGGSLRFDDRLSAFVPNSAVQAVTAIGGAAGDLDNLNIEPLWEVLGKGKKFVDFGNDVTAADVALAARENYRSVEHLKRYTTLGMGVDQGKTSNVNGLAILGMQTGRAPDEVGTTRFRPPYTPVTFGALAGPEVGSLFRPIRHLPAHDWHQNEGAVFEEYGGWARPAAYPRESEDWHQAARREALAARRAAVLFDGSPLGKIEVRGTDAGIFLDRMYVGTMSSVREGRARYGIMLSEHGVIVDDGVVARLGDNHFLVHTTSAGAERAAATFDEWLQCEWAELDVQIFNVTTQWATLTVSGPRARDVLNAAGSDLDLSAFPHMHYRQGVVAGLPARVLRASFTGEASYEVSVKADGASQLAQVIWTAGQLYGLTLVGVEAIDMLRLEKGFIHVGVDTDGTTLPADMGFAQSIGKKASDFVGRRSLMRQDARRESRLQFVGLLSDRKIPAGAQVLDAQAGVPGLSDGHVTSSIDSPTLNRPLALALIRRGRSRLGETVALYDQGTRYQATIASPVFFDPDGEALRG